MNHDSLTKNKYASTLYVDKEKYDAQHQNCYEGLFGRANITHEKIVDDVLFQLHKNPLDQQHYVTSSKMPDKIISIDTRQNNKDLMGGALDNFFKNTDFTTYDKDLLSAEEGVDYATNLKFIRFTRDSYFDDLSIYRYYDFQNKLIFTKCQKIDHAFKKDKKELLIHNDTVYDITTCMDDVNLSTWKPPIININKGIECINLEDDNKFDVEKIMIGDRVAVKYSKKHNDDVFYLYYPQHKTDQECLQRVDTHDGFVDTYALTQKSSKNDKSPKNTVLETVAELKCQSAHQIEKNDFVEYCLQNITNNKEKKVPKNDIENVNEENIVNYEKCPNGLFGERFIVDTFTDKKGVFWQLNWSPSNQRYYIFNSQKGIIDTGYEKHHFDNQDNERHIFDTFIKALNDRSDEDWCSYDDCAMREYSASEYSVTGYKCIGIKGVKPNDSYVFHYYDKNNKFVYARSTISKYTPIGSFKSNIYRHSYIAYNDGNDYIRREFQPSECQISDYLNSINPAIEITEDGHRTLLFQDAIFSTQERFFHSVHGDVVKYHMDKKDDKIYFYYPDYSFKNEECLQVFDKKTQKIDTYILREDCMRFTKNHKKEFWLKEVHKLPTLLLQDVSDKNPLKAMLSKYLEKKTHIKPAPSKPAPSNLQKDNIHPDVSQKYVNTRPNVASKNAASQHPTYQDAGFQTSFTETQNREQLKDVVHEILKNTHDSRSESKYRDDILNQIRALRSDVDSIKQEIAFLKKNQLKISSNPVVSEQVNLHDSAHISKDQFNDNKKEFIELQEQYIRLSKSYQEIFKSINSIRDSMQQPVKPSQDSQDNVSRVEFKNFKQALLNGGDVKTFKNNLLKAMHNSGVSNDEIILKEVLLNELIDDTSKINQDIAKIVKWTKEFELKHQNLSKIVYENVEKVKKLDLGKVSNADFAKLKEEFDNLNKNVGNVNNTDFVKLKEAFDNLNKNVGNVNNTDFAKLKEAFDNLNKNVGNVNNDDFVKLKEAFDNLNKSFNESKQELRDTQYDLQYKSDYLTAGASGMGTGLIVSAGLLAVSASILTVIAAGIATFCVSTLLIGLVARKTNLKTEIADRDVKADTGENVGSNKSSDSKKDPRIIIVKNTLNNLKGVEQFRE